MTLFTSFLFITRTVYNIIAISINRMKLPDFGFDWINVSDQADLVDLTEVKKFITFSIVLLIWEIVPTSVVVIIFRIKRTEVTESTVNAEIIPRVIRKSIFSDVQQHPAINYESIEEERESLLNHSIKSTESTSRNIVNRKGSGGSSSSSYMYSTSITNASYDTYSKNNSPTPFNIRNENFTFNNS